MKLKVCRVKDFTAQISGKRLICFGAGKRIETICEVYPQWDLPGRIEYIVDNNPQKQGTSKRLGGRDIPIRSLEDLLLGVDENTVLLLTILDFREAYGQLEALSQLKNIPCFSPTMIQMYEADKLNYTGQTPPEGFLDGLSPRIPKVIHYCWFGRNPIPDEYLVYMESWERYCPDYEIVRWDEDNYDVTKHPYMWEAYKAKKWAFASDYAHLDIVYKHGGFCLDADVDLLKSLDGLRFHSAYCGLESNQKVAFGLGFGAVKGLPVIKALRDHYDTQSFLNPDGSYNLTPSPSHQTEVLSERGFRSDGSFQEIDGMTVYPIEYFCPVSYGTGFTYVTSNSFSIHRCNASWLGERLKTRDQQMREFFQKAEEVTQ